LVISYWILACPERAKRVEGLLVRMLIQFTAVALAYFSGAIPFGLLIARARGVDIRKVGSGNIGATNVFRMVGKPWGIATFVCDALKGFIPAYLFPILIMKAGISNPLPSLGILCGFAAILGHNFPVFLYFKGGKGIATSAGVLLGVAPVAVAIGLITWVALFLGTRYVSVASIGAAAAVPVSAWVLYGSSDKVMPILLTILGMLAIWRHRSNIKRLVKGTEHRFGRTE